jgi:uncharacterized protein (TIGR03437 family)
MDCLYKTNREVIMSISMQGLLLTVLISMLGGSAQARNVFLLPTGSSPGGTGVGNVYSPDPFTQIGSFQTPQFTSNVLALPNGSRYYVTSRSGSDTLWVLDGNNIGAPALKKYNLGTQAEASVISGDGRRVAIAAGTLHVFDTSTDFEISSFSSLDVGNTPVDVAISLDSQYVYVLSSNSNKLTAVSLVSGQVTGTFSVPGQSTGVSVGPNGYIYVSAVNRVFELDGRNGSLVQLNAIQLNARPGKLSFSNDGRYGLAVNQTPITGSIFLMIDLSNKTVAGSITNLANVTLDKLAVVSNNRVFAYSSGNQQLYDISLSPLNINGTSFNNIGNISNISGIAVSNEFPSARFLFIVTPSAFYRIDLNVSPGSQNGQFVNASSGSGIVYAGPSLQYPASVPTQALYYNTIQSATPGTNYAPLIVRVLDSFGRPVMGVPVAYTSSSGLVQVQGGNQVTDGQGYALVNVTAPATPGTYIVTANSGGASSGITANFTLSVGTTSGPGGGNGAVQIVGGNGQVIPEFALSGENFVVKVTDANGKPVPNTSVTFTIPAGSATLIPPVNTTTTGSVVCQANSCSSTTDANGLAAIALSSTQVTPGYSFAQTTMSAATGNATTNFIFTTVIGYYQGQRAAPPLVEVLAPTGLITAQAGQALPGAIKIRTTIQSGPQTGLALPNVGVRVSSINNNDPTLGPTATCLGGIVLTDSAGVATCDLVTGGKIGTTQLVAYVGSIIQTNPIALTVNPGPPSIIRIVQGNNQSGRAGAPLQLAFVAEITDAAGNVLPGAPAQWEIATPGSIVLSNIVGVADQNGRVSALGALGQLPGQNVVRVRSGTASASFTFTVNITIVAMNKIQGDGQTVFVNSSLPQALIIELRDDQGRAVSGSAVNFSVVSGQASLSPSGGAVTTDSSGRASVSVVAGSLAGDLVIRATAAGFSQTFNLTVRPPGPVFSSAGVVNAASGAAGVVPCGIVTIFGSNIGVNIQGVVTSTFLPIGLPYSLSGVTVTFNGTPAPIFSIANVNGQQQVTVQAPCELAGQTSTSVTIVSGGSTTVSGISVFPTQPGIFEADLGTGRKVAILLRPDGSVVTGTNPAMRGEVLRMFATGLGMVTPASGTNRAGNGTQAVIAGMVVGVNDQGIDVISAQLESNLIGVYTVAFTLPLDTATGTNRNLALAAYRADGSLAYGNGTAIAAIQ